MKWLVIPKVIFCMAWKISSDALPDKNYRTDQFSSED